MRYFQHVVTRHFWFVFATLASVAVTGTATGKELCRRQPGQPFMTESGQVCPPPGARLMGGGESEFEYVMPDNWNDGPAPISERPTVPAEVPYWTTFTDPIEQAIAWCITKDSNKQIRHKSMRDGNCLSYIAEFPPVAFVTEHDLGKAATFAACNDQGILESIPLGSFGPISAIMACQCHNIGVQNALAQDPGRTTAALRKLGGCS
ncbi:MAG: hypothetical protein EOP83_23700 [Verrucomicrobiaceae bacterium]|nr:MAG: hypothetical protein EOP83_23700 [Verrucomicrobiaceae bacterium]